jgi:Protein of unknown function (DUF2892)
MARNLGSADRIGRVVAAVALFAGSILAPVPLLAQAALALAGVYMLGSSLVGTCLGYKLMGVSTCPIKQQRLGT